MTHIKKDIFIIIISLFICIGLSFFNGKEVAALENGLARTPPMGWSSWNIFGGDIDEWKIKEITDALVSSGMRDAGYIYVNLDDKWMDDNGRDADGNLIGDLDRFPGGIKALADYIHSLGLKIGIYGDRGTATCCNVPESGSQGNEVRDANTWASWGIDYLKYDSCNASLDLRTQYETMRDALAQCGRPICYSICCWYFVGEWMIDCGNLWRTTSDISDNWGSIMNIADSNEPLYPHAGPGHWNDPDMLEVGNGNCTFEEYKSHFSLWCIMAAPLIAGNDVRSMSPETLSILCNTEAIAVDQDPAGIQGRRIIDNGDLEIWVKPLGSSNGTDKAVLLLNRGGGSASITVNWADIGVSGPASIRDLWAHADRGSYSDSYSANVPSHGVVMLKVLGSGSTTTPDPTQVHGPTPTLLTTQVPGNRGDVNSSGTIDIVDALLVAQYYVGLDPSNFAITYADVDCNDQVDIVDALLIAQYYVGLLTSFC